MTIERSTKGNKRTYTKPKRDISPLVGLVPTALDVLKSVFHSGSEAPSVTTILGALAKPALIQWAAKEERKMIAALAARLYERLYLIVDEPVSPEKFYELLMEEAGKGGTP